ncbi:TPA: hypothetical protein DCX16_05180 [bacterium]|nr:hypothetical protein [bacterium]
MNSIFRVCIFIACIFLVFLGYLLISLGFGIIGIGNIAIFIKKWIGFIGISIWMLVIFIFILEKKIFSFSDGINIEGEFGKVWITKKAIEGLVESIEIEGCENISCKVSIKGKLLDIKVSIICFTDGIVNVIESINREISYLLEDVCLIRNYKKKVEITKIKRRRQLK